MLKSAKRLLESSEQTQSLLESTAQDPKELIRNFEKILENFDNGPLTVTKKIEMLYNSAQNRQKMINAILEKSTLDYTKQILTIQAQMQEKLEIRHKNIEKYVWSHSMKGPKIKVMDSVA